MLYYEISEFLVLQLFFYVIKMFVSKKAKKISSVVLDIVILPGSLCVTVEELNPMLGGVLLRTFEVIMEQHGV